MPTIVDRVAKFTVVVSDKWQGPGLATYLLSSLTAAVLAGITQLEGFVLSDNSAMLKLGQKPGVSLTRCADDKIPIRIVRALKWRTNAMGNCSCCNL